MFRVHLVGLDSSFWSIAWSSIANDFGVVFAAIIAFSGVMVSVIYTNRNARKQLRKH